LLDAGASLAGLSINRIAEESGVSRATFYLHFPDKRTLIARLAETELMEFERVTDPFFEDPDAGRAEMARVFDDVIQLWRDHAGVLSSLVELAEYDADSRVAWQSIIEAIGARTTVAIRDRRPELSAGDAAALGQVIAWAGERSCHQMIGRESTPADARRVSKALTEAIWRIIEPT
jgi:AcrR family transcriptional regulator